MQNEITKKYDSEAFRQDGHKVVDLLADYIKNTTSGKNEKMYCDETPDEMFEKFKYDFKNPANVSITDIITKVLNNVTQLHHPHFIGHQVSAALPVSALADFTTALLNNSDTVHEMGPAACGIEKNIVNWMCKKVGWDENSGGFLTSGGSIGNLTALLAARQAKGDYNVWQDGVKECEGGDENLYILVSSQCHYSVKRAAAIIGLGENSAVAVPVDENFCMRIDALEEEYKKAQNAGKKVFAVVANACSTATGSYDDIEAIADFCEKYGLWLHVDGAHGAPALLSETHKHLLKGAERADSIIWDGHKMMMASAVVTGALFKDGKVTHQIFSQKASYLLGKNIETNWYDYGLQTLECTKPFMGLKMYIPLKLYGEKFFGDYIDYVYGLTKEFAKILSDAPDFEIATQPQSNIICFRFIRNLPDSALSELQMKIRGKLLNGEKFYIAKTELNEKTYLRCTVINPNTTLAHIEELIEEIRKIAKDF